MNEDDPLSPMIKGSFSTITKEVGVEVPSHAQRILRKLSEMRSNANLCDTELCCDGQSFQVHRSVLAGGSSYFANYFDRWVTDPAQKQVVLRTVEAGALSVILDFLYSGVLNITTANMFDIFVAADKLQVEEARFVCITKLHVHLNPESCVDTLNFAMLYSLPALGEAAINLICTEPLVYNLDSSAHLSAASWKEIKRWLLANRSVVSPYTATYNLLQIHTDCAKEIRAIFGGMIDARTEGLLTTTVLPTALSILSAARANAETKGESTQDLPTDTTRVDDTPPTLPDSAQLPSLSVTSNENLPTSGENIPTSDGKISASAENSPTSVQINPLSAENITTSAEITPTTAQNTAAVDVLPPLRDDVMSQTLQSHTLVLLDEAQDNTAPLHTTPPPVQDNTPPPVQHNTAPPPQSLAIREPAEEALQTAVIPPTVVIPHEHAQDPRLQSQLNLEHAAARLQSRIIERAAVEGILRRSVRGSTEMEGVMSSSGEAGLMTSPEQPAGERPGAAVEEETTENYPNSRHWTISCNHPGYSESSFDERLPKKRRVMEEPHWLTKIVLLGGCNSTMSTVRTIFRHIQPFSVVTGVTVVRDNLSLNIHSDKKSGRTEEWEDSGCLSQLCYGCAATTAGTMAYVFGGKNANSQFLAEFQQFDMVSNTSKMLPRGPQSKENAVAVRIGEDIYIVGGRNSTSQHSQYIVDKYNITHQTWQSVAPCFKIGYLGAAAACNGLLYTFCGQRPHGKATDTVMCYEPHSDSWSPQPNAPTTMNACQATTYQRKIFLLATEYKNLILFHFQPDHQLWSKVNKCEPYVSEPQNFFIMNSAIVSHEGYLYVLLFMCEDVVRVIRVQKFNIATGEWEIVSTKPVPVQNSGVVLTSFMSNTPVALPTSDRRRDCIL